MPVSWLSLLDVAVDLTNLALSKRSRQAPVAESPALESPASGRLETHLAGVVVAALKEAFDRDSRRVELEREQIALERERAERALKMELRRQAGEREIGRLRLAAGIAFASLVGLLLVSLRLAGSPVHVRVVLAAAWLLLLGGLSLAFTGQSSIGRALVRIDDPAARPDDLVAGQAAPWLIVLGMAAIAIAVLAA